MKKIVEISGIMLGLLVLLAMWTPAAFAWTVTKWKTKSLPIAGDVTFTSSISATSGETITIEIQPVDASVTISSVVLDKATPKPKSLIGTSTYITPGSAGGHTIDVTLTNGQGFKTFHLWLYLSTNEHIGVNVHFPSA